MKTTSKKDRNRSSSSGSHENSEINHISSENIIADFK